MLPDFDNTLKQLLVQRVPLDPSAVDISFECPTRAWSATVAKPTVNLYLFDLRENTPLRQGGQAVERGPDGPSGTRPPPVLFDLSYVITVWAPDIATEHQLLWQVMITLMRQPQIGPDLLQGALKTLGPPVKTATAQWDGVLHKPGELWSAVDNTLKPAITYTATLSVDIHPLRAAPPVLTKVIFTGNTKRTQRDRLVAIGGIVRTRPAAEGAPQRVVADAEVTFPQLGLTVRSDGDGRYVVPEIPPGKHRVQVATAAGVTAESEIQVPAPNYNLEV
jgi:hypothetical protein